MAESPLNAALRHFEAAEANLVKAEKVLADIDAAVPKGIVFGGNPDYESNCLNFDALLSALPKIDGWKPSISLMELDAIAQNRLDAQEVGEVECIISVERQIGEPPSYYASIAIASTKSGGSSSEMPLRNSSILSTQIFGFSLNCWSLISNRTRLAKR